MTELPKILWVGNFLSAKGGSRGVNEDLVDQLRQKGWVITTVSKFKNRFLRYADILFTIFQKRKNYDSAHIDVYSGAAFVWAESAAFFLRFLKKSYYLTLHGGNLPDFSKKNTGRVVKLLKSAKAVTAPSGYLVAQMKPYREEIKLIPNPIDVSRYSFSLRRQLLPKLVWLRAFHSVYNPTLAVSILDMLRIDFPEINILMVGPDKGDGSLQEVQKKANELGVSGKIQIVPGIQKAEVPEMMNRGDIYINTTKIDNTPVSVMEAMACGLCVVSTNVGGISYLLEHEKDALLVPSDNAEAMANAVKRLLNDPELAGELSQNARKKAENFDWSKVLPKWIGLLTSSAA